jgi:hypothetical protein
MMKLEERVARALMDVRAALPAGDGTEYPVLDMDPDFDDLPLDHTQGTDDDPITQEAVLRLARAAIAAMREPNNAMTLAGRLQIPDAPDPRDMADAFRAMIDEALKT